MTAAATTLLLLLLLAALAACAFGQSSLDPYSHGCHCKEKDLPLCKNLCQKPKLTPQQKIELQQANKDLAKRLAHDAHALIHNFIDKLEDEKTYVKLTSPINLGHSIRFKFIEGDEDAVEEIAAEMGLHVKGDSIEVPEGLEHKLREIQQKENHANSQAASEKWQEARKLDAEGEVHLPDVATQYISPEQAMNLHNSNRASVLQLKPWAAHKILQFLKKIADSHNHIRLYGGIKDGHVIDYELINGIRSEVVDIGKAFDLEVTDHSISTKGTVNSDHDDDHHTSKVSDAFSPDPHHEAESKRALESNCPKPGCPKDDDVVIVPAPGHALRSNQPNTMLVGIYTPPGGPIVHN